MCDCSEVQGTCPFHAKIIHRHCFIGTAHCTISLENPLLPAYSHFVRNMRNIMSSDPSNPSSFVAALQPFLAAKNAGALSQYVRHHYTSEQLCSFVNAPATDVCKVAALALGLVGDHRCIPSLVKRLADS